LQFRLLILLLGEERAGQENVANSGVGSRRSWNFDVSSQGFRCHMSNIMAAIGVVQIDRIDEFRSVRQNIARKYIKELLKLEDINLLDFNFNETLPHIFVIKGMQ